MLYSGNNGSLLFNEKWARVTVEYKRLVILHMQPLLLLPSSQREEFFCYLAFKRNSSFSLHLLGHQPTDCQHILCSILCLVFIGGESFNLTFREEILIFVCNHSFNQTRHICGHLSHLTICFIVVVYYLSSKLLRRLAELSMS